MPQPPLRFTRRISVCYYKNSIPVSYTHLMGMSDRIVVMHEGVMTAIVDRKDFSSELILKYATSEVPYQPAADKQ